MLDPVLEAYVELDRSREELEAQFDPAIVERTLQLVDRAEYKRRQAAPGVKLRPARVRPGLADADHQSLAGLRLWAGPTAALRAQAGAGSD